MIDKDEWQTAYRELLADGRRRVGPPPTAQEVEALFDGNLSDPDAERVRELLAYYPEMARALTEPFPADAEGVLTEEELATDLAKIRERVRLAPSPEPVVAISRRRWWPRDLAIAASVLLAVSLGGLVVWRTMQEPRPMASLVLYPDGNRGGSRGGPSTTPTQLSTDFDYALQPLFSSRRHYREYRFELLDVTTTPPRRIWRRDNIERQPDGSYSVTLSTEKLEPGLYRLILYGMDGTIERLAEYTFRLRAR